MRALHLSTFLVSILALKFSFTDGKSLPLVVSTWGTPQFQKAAQRAWDSLSLAPDRRLWALVEGLSECEAEQCDTTVGYGGSPDENGETTLDAMVLDGPGYRMGAVGALRRIRSAARVAWAVMNYTEHSFLAGSQATEFAIGMGFLEQSLTTNFSWNQHEQWRHNSCQPNYRQNVEPDPHASCGPYKPLDQPTETKNMDRKIGPGNHDTIGLIVIDQNGDISAGTSTNGAKTKVPGRVGDSPIPGAGAYVDNDVGAAAGTGDGDIMMRFLPSLIAVEAMRTGVRPRKAAEIAIRRIKKWYPDFMGAVIVANKNGQYGAACNGFPTFPYSVVAPNNGTVRLFKVKCFKREKP